MCHNMCLCGTVRRIECLFQHPYTLLCNPKPLRCCIPLGEPNYGVRAANEIERVILQEGPDECGALILEAITSGGLPPFPPPLHWNTHIILQQEPDEYSTYSRGHHIWIFFPWIFLE